MCSVLLWCCFRTSYYTSYASYTRMYIIKIHSCRKDKRVRCLRPQSPQPAQRDSHHPNPNPALIGTRVDSAHLQFHSTAVHKSSQRVERARILGRRRVLRTWGGGLPLLAQWPEDKKSMHTGKNSSNVKHAFYPIVLIVLEGQNICHMWFPRVTINNTMRLARASEKKQFFPSAPGTSTFFFNTWYQVPFLIFDQLYFPSR